MPLAGIWCLNWANYSLSPTGNCGFEKGREGKTENLVVYQVVGTFPECLPTLRLVAGGRACPRTPGLPFDPAGGTLPKPAACY